MDADTETDASLKSGFSLPQLPEFGGTVGLLELHHPPFNGFTADPQPQLGF